MNTYQAYKSEALKWKELMAFLYNDSSRADYIPLGNGRMLQMTKTENGQAVIKMRAPGKEV